LIFSLYPGNDDRIGLGSAADRVGHLEKIKNKRLGISAQTLLKAA